VIQTESSFRQFNKVGQVRSLEQTYGSGHGPGRITKSDIFGPGHGSEVLVSQWLFRRLSVLAEECAGDVCINLARLLIVTNHLFHYSVQTLDSLAQLCTEWSRAIDQMLPVCTKIYPHNVQYY